MEEVKKVIDELGISALENSIKVAGVAVLSDSGEIFYQTKNWDLTNQTTSLLNVLKGDRSFVLSNSNFSVVETTTEGIIGTSDSGMGHVIFVPFQGGVLVSYAMPQADPPKTLSFLKKYAMKLDGKI